MQLSGMCSHVEVTPELVSKEVSGTTCLLSPDMIAGVIKQWRCAKKTGVSKKCRLSNMYAKL